MFKMSEDYGFMSPQELIRDRIKGAIDKIINQLRERDGQAVISYNDWGARFSYMAADELEKAGYKVERIKGLEKHDKDKVIKIIISLP